jgi:hypothetical protein
MEVSMQYVFKSRGCCFFSLIVMAMMLAGTNVVSVAFAQEVPRGKGSCLSGIGGCRTPKWVLEADSAHWYRYRILMLGYDSTALRGWFGEIFVIGKDSQQVRFDLDFEIGKDTTLEYINSAAVTKPFCIRDRESISIWRSITIHYCPQPLNLDLADTCSWTTDLYDNHTKRRIATIDSFITLPQLEGNNFPKIATGNDRSYDYINVDLKNPLFDGIDSVYIGIRMSRKGNGRPRHIIKDVISLYNKLSE